MPQKRFDMGHGSIETTLVHIESQSKLLNRCQRVHVDMPPPHAHLQGKT